MSAVDIVPFELLCELLRPCTRESLYHCTLVCSSFKEAALPSLYRTITLKTLRTSESGEGLHFTALETLDKYEYLRSYVRDVRFHFALSDYVRLTRPTKSAPKPLPNVWVNSLAKLPSVASYTFSHVPFAAFPDSHNHFLPIPHELIELTASALTNCNSLGELNLLYRTTTSDISRFKSSLNNVRSIRLGLPSREVIAAVGPWIEQCESFSISDAYALDTLTTIQPHIANLSMLHLGPHHALSNVDLLQLLKYTSKLRDLDVFYDNFLNVQLLNKGTKSFPGLKHLDRLVIRHQGVSSKAQYIEMFNWLEVVSLASPLTSLSVLSDDGRECNFALPLINLLAKKPIVFLNIPHIVLRQPSLRMLFGRHNKLRVLSIMLVDANDLGFYTTVSPDELTCNLSALYLRSNRTTCSYSILTTQLRRTIISLRGTPGYLRRLSQKKQTWNALWTEGLQTERQGIDPLKDEYGVYSNATELDGW